MMTPHALASPFFDWLLRASVQGAVLVILILLLQAMLRRWLSPRWQSALWLILLVRLALPWSPGSPISLYNWVHLPEKSMSVRPISNAPASPVNLPSTAVTSGIPSGLGPLVSRNMLENEKHGYMRWLFFVAWAMGASALLARTMIPSLRLSRRMAGHRLVTDQRVLAILEDCKEEMKMHAYLSVIEAPEVQSPALFGVIRPRLLLPMGLSARLTSQELRHVFLHELAHLKRHDVALGWAAALLLSLHWFNPFVWWAAWRMRADRELACDALVFSTVSQGESGAYGRTIVQLLENLTGSRPLASLAGVLEGKSLMKRRITMIAQFKSGSYRSSVFVVLLFALLGCAALTDSKAQEKVLPRGQIAGNQQSALDNAELLYQEKKYKEAIEAYKKIHATWPKWNYAEHAVMMIGLCQEKLGDPKAAMESMEAAVKTYPNLKGLTETTWFYLGGLYQQAGRKDDAVKAYQQCLELAKGVRDENGFPMKAAREQLAALQGTDPSGNPPSSNPSDAQSGVDPDSGVPRIVSTSPKVGAQDVDPATGEITITFDRDMGGGMSWTGGGEYYPPIIEGQRPAWRDKRTCVMPVKLEAGKYYRVGINSKSYRNFRSAGGVPAPVSEIYFATKGASDEVKALVQKPTIVKMEPANDAADISPAIAELRVTFNVPMGGGFSWCGGGEHYPAIPEGQKTVLE